MAGNRRENPGNLPPLAIEHVQVLAKHADDHLPRFAGDRFTDAIPEKREHFGLDAGKTAKGRPDPALRLLLLLCGRPRLQLDVEFAPVRAPGVLAHFRASDLLLDRLDVRNFEQLRRDPFPQPAPSPAGTPRARSKSAPRKGPHGIRGEGPAKKPAGHPPRRPPVRRP